jgi:hypothetical protein
VPPAQRGKLELVVHVVVEHAQVGISSHDCWPNATSLSGAGLPTLRIELIC